MMSNRQKLTIVFTLSIAIAFSLGYFMHMYISGVYSNPLPEARSQLAMYELPDEELGNVIYIAPGTDIQTTIENSTNQSIFIIGAGTHRLQSINPRTNDIFIGEDGAILNGSVLLTDIEEAELHWIIRHEELANLEPVIGGVCRVDFERCNHPYDIYVDNEPLIHVNSMNEVGEGTWYFDYEADQIILGTNPSGHIIELSVLFHAFRGTASNVIIQNLVIEKYAGYGQQGAIRAQDANGWIIADNIVRLNSGAGITFGSEMLILNNSVVQNGQIGISGQGSNVVINKNEIAYNNYAQYEPSWEAGGTKFVATTNLVVSDNYVHHNDGPGLWTDIDNINTLYEHNLVVANNGSGILHEISYDAIIRYNVIRYNLNTNVSVYAGAQIMISSSSNVEVYANEVITGTQGGNTIVIVQQDRGYGQYGAYRVSGIDIYNNDIIYLNNEGETAAATDVADADWFWESIQFRSNRYYGTDINANLWGWQNTSTNWQNFQQVVESDGQYITQIPIEAVSSPPWQSVRGISNR